MHAQYLTQALSMYFPALLEEDSASFHMLFAMDDVPELHDPRLGTIKGRCALEAFYQTYHNWLHHHGAFITPVQSWHQPSPEIGTDDFAAVELVLHLRLQGQHVELPVLIVGRADCEKCKFNNIRIYHSHWPLLCQHRQRVPFLYERALPLPEPVRRYVEALAAGDMDELLDTLDLKRISVREPSGDMHSSQKALEKFYNGFFSYGGGLPLHHCNAVDNGRHCALEFFIDQIGSQYCAPQAGGAVYEYDAKAGKIISIRIYDDFDPNMRNAGLNLALTQTEVMVFTK